MVTVRTPSRLPHTTNGRSPGQTPRGTHTNGELPAYEPPPRWAPRSGELWVGEVLVLHFTRGSSDPRRLIEALARAGWPDQLPDPLRKPGEIGPRFFRRLRTAVANLNRNRKARCLHFFVTDAGHRFGWHHS